jgi:hypothetical protein
MGWTGNCGLISSRGRDISLLKNYPDQPWAHSASPSVGVTQGSIGWLTKLTSHIHLVLKLRMSGVIPHSPVYLYGMHGNNFKFIFVSLTL